MNWGFDNVDRRTQMTLNSPTVSVKRTFAYSIIDQLTNSNTSIIPSTGKATNSTNTYTLDANDNRTKLNSTSYTNNLADQTTAAGAQALTFNGAGAISGASATGGNASQSFVYDWKDQLTKFSSGATTVAYTYNANNKMTARTVNGTNTTSFLWDGGAVTKEYMAFCVPILGLPTLFS